MQRKTIIALLAFFVSILMPSISLSDHLTIPHDLSETLKAPDKLPSEAQQYLQGYGLPANDIDFPMKVEEKLKNISVGDSRQVVKMIMFVKPTSETDEKLIYDLGKKWDRKDKKNFRVVILFKEGKTIEKYITYDGYVEDFSEIRKNATRQEKE